MKDKLGNEITVGNYIVYAGRKGSRLWLTLGRVLGRTPNRIRVIGIEGSTLKSRSSILTISNTIAVMNESLVSDKYKAIFDDAYPIKDFIAWRDGEI